MPKDLSKVTSEQTRNSRYYVENYENFIRGANTKNYSDNEFVKVFYEKYADNYNEYLKIKNN